MSVSLAVLAGSGIKLRPLLLLLLGLAESLGADDALEPAGLASAEDVASLGVLLLPLLSEVVVGLVLSDEDELLSRGGMAGLPDWSGSDTTIMPDPE